jgi:predicted TIM-barrel fold metal-dependent hydrolase
MASKTGSQIIAIEEHYLDPDVAEKTGGRAGGKGKTRERLQDLGEWRLREMDEAGIDIQVLSHCPPGAQCFEAAELDRAKAVNDRLSDTVKANPARFGAFASLPLKNPDAAPDELERCVKDLGFRGAMVHGLTEGRFIDDPVYWPIFKRAQDLDVPLYVHPGPPHPAVIEAYYKDYVQKFPSIMSAGWGFTVETATAGVRLMLSGVLQEYPGTKIILGHMGEGLPFLLWRINMSFGGMHPEASTVPIRELFCKHFWITTSGNFSNPALLCSVMEMGVDRIIYSVDWPYVMNTPGSEWMEGVPLSQEDRDKILHGNAKKLLKM